MLNFWTDDTIAELRRRWDLGESCSVIAAAMRNSRNAIIGKAHRLGLPPRAEVMPLEERAKRNEQRNASRVVRQRVERGTRFIEPVATEPLPTIESFIGALNIPFGDLRPFSSDANQCRYIAAEPAGPDYLACGNETLAGESWCGHHHDAVHARPINLSDADRLRRRLQWTKLGMSKVVRKDDIEDEAA